MCNVAGQIGTTTLKTATKFMAIDFVKYITTNYYRWHCYLKLQYYNTGTIE